MLDDRRKEFLRKVRVQNIKPNGVLWTWGREVSTIRLNKEDIRYLRWYHHDPNIAYEVDVHPPQRRFEMASDRNKYDNCRTRKKPKRNGLGRTIIIGSLLVSIVVGPALFYNHSEAVDKEPIAVEIKAPEYYAANEEEYTIGEVQTSNREDIIRHLCDIYQVDYQRTYDKLRELTDDFNSIDYINGCIPGVTCKGETVYANSEEELLVYAVRAIKQLPDRFGLDESIRINNGYSSGTDYYAQISDVCEILGLDRNLMYAIVRSETSFNSDLFMNSNNPAGLIGVNGEGWWQFATKEEGFLEFGMELLKYYRMIGENPYNVDPEIVKQIGDIHAPLSDGNDLWLPNVLDCLEYAQNNEYELFGGEEVHGLGR